MLHSGVVKPDVDLYNERVKVIDWYERNAPYSLHPSSKWSHYPAPRLLPSFSRSLFNAKLKDSATSCLERICFVKYQLLRKSKFNFAYENVQLKRNYITEKIFDSMNCLSVPIYWGPLNTSKLIPTSTYIDPRNFRNNTELYLYLNTMSDQEYQSYLSCIYSFVNSDRSIAFKADKFAETIVQNIIPLLS